MIIHDFKVSKIRLNLLVKNIVPKNTTYIVLHIIINIILCKRNNNFC